MPRKPKLPPADTWLDDVPPPYRHCTTCQHHKPKDHPFGLCKKGLHQADDERCQEYRRIERLPRSFPATILLT